MEKETSMSVDLSEKTWANEILVQRYLSPRVLRWFAADCAQRALTRANVQDQRLWRATITARLYALGNIGNGEMQAAVAIANDVTSEISYCNRRSHTKDAAYSVVYAVAYATPHDPNVQRAAHDAATGSAIHAVRDAARYRVKDKERAWQVHRLRYLCDVWGIAGVRGFEMLFNDNCPDDNCPIPWDNDL